MERKTQDIETSTGNKVTLKTYLTYNEIEPIMANEAISKTEQSKMLIQASIVSFDGIGEGAYEKIRELPFADYTVITGIVTKMVGGDFQTAK